MKATARSVLPGQARKKGPGEKVWIFVVCVSKYINTLCDFLNSFLRRENKLISQTNNFVGLKCAFTVKCLYIKKSAHFRY